MMFHNVTSLMFQEDEVQGQSYVFIPPASMQAGIEAGNFLEASELNSPHGSGTYGVSYDGIRDVAATGRHHTWCTRMQQCLACMLRQNQHATMDD
jgi:guanylate kinase